MILKKSKFLIISISSLIIIGTCILFYNYNPNDKYKSSEVSEIVINKLSYKPAQDILSTRSFTDKSDITKFLKAFNSKNKLNVKIDIRPPEYSVIIKLKDNSKVNYNLWINDTTQGLIMDNHNVWKLSQSSTNAIRDLLK